jgi:hypothetical protein
MTTAVYGLYPASATRNVCGSAPARKWQLAHATVRSEERIGSKKSLRPTRALEAFRIDKELVGRETSYGPIPQTLRPIFRDSEDFTAGHTLTDQTIAALDASAGVLPVRSGTVTERPRANGPRPGGTRAPLQGQCGTRDLETQRSGASRYQSDQMAMACAG